MTVRETLAQAVATLEAAGIDTPRLDAEVLRAHVLGVERARLLIDDLVVEGPAVRAYQDAVRRRAVEHEPVAYIVGRRGFRHLELRVDPRVLIPRPETEHVVEAVVELAPSGASVVDVGTGSGAIALAVADERPDLRVVGSDVSADALDVARGNGGGVEWVQADLVPPGEWDVVVSNPPYVRDDEPLPPDVDRHEPALALRAGPDGLAFYRRLAEVPAPLRIVEVGEGQAGDVAALFGGRTEIRRDLAGIERVVIAWA